jgi:hypothetical protein
MPSGSDFDHLWPISTLQQPSRGRLGTIYLDGDAMNMARRRNFPDRMDIFVTPCNRHVNFVTAAASCWYSGSCAPSAASGGPRHSSGATVLSEDTITLITAGDTIMAL